MKIYLDTSPLLTGHVNRGIGTYTRELQHQFKSHSLVQLATSQENADLVHYPFFDFFSASLSLNNNKPTIVTIHDVHPLIFPDHYPAGIKGKFNLWRQKRTLKKISAVITDSNSSKKDIVNLLSVPDSKVHVVPLAASPKLKKPTLFSAKSITEQYQLPKKYILYVGDINYNKNIPQLILALKYLPDDLYLVLLGKNFRAQDIPEWTAIELALSAQNLRSRVKFLTNVDSSRDLSSIYHQAVAYIQPSLYEGFGLPILEALNCETIVVSSNNSSLSEVGGNVVEYSKSEDAASLAQSVQIVLNLSKNEREKAITAGLKWASTFSWKKTASNTIKVYQQVLSEFKNV